ncbi:MAG: peptidylprolyl isomerase [Pseudomonadota bacterium]
MKLNTLRAGATVLALLAAQYHAFAADTPSSSETTLDGIVAVINSNVVLQSDLDKSVNAFRSRASQRGQSIPDNVDFRRQVLAHLVSQEVQLQEAAARGIRVSDSQLNNQMRNIASDNDMSLSEFRRSINEDGGDYRDVRKEVRTEMIVRRLYDRQVLGQITVSDQEIKDYLSAKAKSDNKATEYSLQRILIGLSENAESGEIGNAQKLADSLVEQLRGGADFATLAVQHSTAAEALNGGDIGTMPPSSMPTVYADAVVGQPVGSISDPIRTTNGFHILRIADKAGQKRHVVTQIRLRHIVLQPSAVRDEATTRDELSNLRKRIVLGDDFAELADAHSEDSVTIGQGGEMPWLNPGDMPRAFEERVSQLEIGELSQPFRTPWGWHVVELLEERSEDVTEQLLEVNARDALRARKAREREELWRRRLLAEAYIEYRVDELAPQQASAL